MSKKSFLACIVSLAVGIIAPSATPETMQQKMHQVARETGVAFPIVRLVTELDVAAQMVDTTRTAKITNAERQSGTIPELVLLRWHNHVKRGFEEMTSWNEVQQAWFASRARATGGADDVGASAAGAAAATTEAAPARAATLKAGTIVTWTESSGSGLETERTGVVLEIQANKVLVCDDCLGTTTAFARQLLAVVPPPPFIDPTLILAWATTRPLSTPPLAVPSDLPLPSDVDDELNRIVKVWKGDITHLGVDAIQNAANAGLWSGGGIDGAIHKAAGPDLKKACWA